MIDYDVPLSVPCPCNRGFAERRPDPIVELNQHGMGRKAVTWNYRHGGCQIGGSIYVVEGSLYRKRGPLFYPERYEGLMRLVDPIGSSETAVSGEVFDEPH